MGKAVDQLRKHSGAGERRSILVPELDDATIYFSKLTGDDHSKAEAREPANNVERNVILLILKAEYEDGTKVFAMGDKFALLHEIEWSVLNRLANFMWAPNFRKTEEAEALIESDPPSVSD